MAPRLLWTAQGRNDLIDICVAIGSDQPAAAERWLDRFEARASLLTAQPRMGVRRADIRPGLRMLVEAPYLILYRIAPDTEEGPVEVVEIVRIVDGRRELASLF
jgi:toxin ParE1/3/4